MSTTLQVRVGIPGSLTIEVIPDAVLVENNFGVIIAPLNQPVTGQAPGSIAKNPDLSTSLMSNAWGRGWATPVTARLAALGGNTNLQLAIFECPSLDTTDMGWYGTGSIDAGTDPVSFDATMTGTSIYGRAFQVGDYVIWDDSSLSPDGTAYQYEIDQITQIAGTRFTLQRRAQFAPQGQAQFATFRYAHAEVNFFRLLNPSLPSVWDGARQLYKFLWDNMIVSAVSFQANSQNGSSVIMNLFPVPPDPAIAGLMV